MIMSALLALFWRLEDTLVPTYICIIANTHLAEKRAPPMYLIRALPCYHIIVCFYSLFIAGFGGTGWWYLHSM